MKLVPAIIIVAVLGVVMTRKAGDATLPLGLRNRNPLNMRDYNINWQGKIGVNRGFVVFDTYENGIRAAGNDLKNKWLRGIKTIRQIVSAWAPAEGVNQDGQHYSNNTESYIRSVSQQAGIGENTELLSLSEYISVVMAMIKHENGMNDFDRSFVAHWLKVGMTSGTPLPFYFGLVSYA